MAARPGVLRGPASREWVFFHGLELAGRVSVILVCDVTGQHTSFSYHLRLSSSQFTSRMRTLAIQSELLWKMPALTQSSSQEADEGHHRRNK